MPLNQPRRIFARSRRRGRGAPSLRLVLASCVGFFGLGATVRVADTLTSLPLPSLSQGMAAPRADSPDVAVLDAETLRLGGRIVRLAGLEAPRPGLSCAAGAACAGAAAVHLAELVKGRDIACDPRGADRAGRTLAACRAGGTDIGRALVASGWAVADAGAPDMRAAEQEARNARLGLWAFR